MKTFTKNILASSLWMATLLFIAMGCGEVQEKTKQVAKDAKELADATKDKVVTAVVGSCVTPPTGMPSSWSADVHPNCFSNLERLGRWAIGDRSLPTADPSSAFVPVTQSDLALIEGVKTNVYVVVHGWAPGLRTAVKAKSGNLKWWDTDATDGSGNWESTWAWAPTGNGTEVTTVSPTGLFQQIMKYENNNPAIALAYSWVDDSATKNIDITSPGSWTVASKSEAYTNMNGLRLASALIELFPSSDWSQINVHLMGHSHGSKVVTTAALALQREGFPVNHLSLFDSPENDEVREFNAANLLGFYFEKMNIASPSGQSGLFVDNYISQFGARYFAAGSVSNMAQIGLNSDAEYPGPTPTDFSERHAFSAAWYANAWNATNTNSWPLLGLEWPPVTVRGNANQYYQEFGWDPFDNQEKELFTLNPGTRDAVVAYPQYQFTGPSMTVDEVSRSGNVTGSASAELIVQAGTNNTTSTFVGKFKAAVTDLYGFSFDMQLEGCVPGDYIVVTVQSPGVGYQVQDVAIVLDGSTDLLNGKWHPVSINSYSADRDFSQFEIHYIPGTTNRSGGKIKVKNFGAIKEKLLNPVL